MSKYDSGHGSEDAMPSVTGSIRKEKCRPDFEGAIETEKDKMVFVDNLYNATREMVLSDLHFGINMGELKDLMGVLHVKAVLGQAGIAKLIHDQERYKE